MTNMMTTIPPLKRRSEHPPVPRLLLVDYTKSRAQTTTTTTAAVAAASDQQTAASPSGTTSCGDQEADDQVLGLKDGPRRSHHNNRRRSSRAIYPRPLEKKVPKRALSLESAVETTVSLLNMSMTGDALKESQPEYTRVDELVHQQNQKRRMTIASTQLKIDPRAFADYMDISESNMDFSMFDQSTLGQESTLDTSGCMSRSNPISEDDYDGSDHYHNTMIDASEQACFVRRTTSRRRSSVNGAPGIANLLKAAPAGKRMERRRRSSVESTYTEDGGPVWSTFGRNVSNPYIKWDHNALVTTPFASRKDKPSQTNVSFQIKRSSSFSSSHKQQRDDELILATAQAIWTEESNALMEDESMVDHTCKSHLSDDDNKPANNKTTSLKDLPPKQQQVANTIYTTRRNDDDDDDSDEEEEEEDSEENMGATTKDRIATAAANLRTEATKEIAAEQAMADRRTKLVEAGKQHQHQRQDNTGDNTPSTTDRRALFAISGKKKSAGTIRMMEQGGENHVNPRIITLGGSSRDVMVAVNRRVAMMMGGDEQRLDPSNNNSSKQHGHSNSKSNNKAKQQKTLLAQFDGHQSMANVANTSSHHFLKTESMRSLMSTSSSPSLRTCKSIDNNALDSAWGTSSRLTSLLEGGISNPYFKHNDDGDDDDGDDDESFISAVTCNTTDEPNNTETSSHTPLATIGATEVLIPPSSTSTDTPAAGLPNYSSPKPLVDNGVTGPAVGIRRRGGTPRRTLSFDDDPKSAIPSLRRMNDASNSEDSTAPADDTGWGGTKRIPRCRRAGPKRSLSYHDPRRLMSDASNASDDGSAMADSGRWSAYRVDSSRRNILASARRKLMADTSERLMKDTSFRRAPSSLVLAGTMDACSFHTAIDQVSTHSTSSEVGDSNSFHTAKMDESSIHSQDSFWDDHPGSKSIGSTSTSSRRSSNSDAKKELPPVPSLTTMEDDSGGSTENFPSSKEKVTEDYPSTDKTFTSVSQSKNTQAGSHRSPVPSQRNLKTKSHSKKNLQSQSDHQHRPGSRRNLMAETISGSQRNLVPKSSSPPPPSHRNMLAQTKSGSRRNLMSKSSSPPPPSRRNLLAQTKSSGSQKNLMANYSEVASSNRRNLLAQSRGRSCKNISPYRSGSRRNLMSESKSPPPSSRRNLMAKMKSCRNIMSDYGSKSRRNLMAENRSTSLNNLMAESDTSHFVTGSRIRRIENASDLTGAKFLSHP